MLFRLCYLDYVKRRKVKLVYKLHKTSFYVPTLPDKIYVLCDYIYIIIIIEYNKVCFIQKSKSALLHENAHILT